MKNEECILIITALSLFPASHFPLPIALSFCHLPVYHSAPAPEELFPSSNFKRHSKSAGPKNLLRGAGGLSPLR